MDDKKWLLVVIPLLAIVAVLGYTSVTGSFVSDADVQKPMVDKSDEIIDFFAEYSIALNNIHIALSYFGTASYNLEMANWYIETSDYYYEYAKDYFDEGKDQILDAKQLLSKARSKLELIEDSVPSKFFGKDIENRIEQINIMILTIDDLYYLLDNRFEQMYEITYGTELKALEHLDGYNERIIEYNSNLQKLSDIQNHIDLEWDQDWYIERQNSLF